MSLKSWVMFGFSRHKSQFHQWLWSLKMYNFISNGCHRNWHQLLCTTLIVITDWPQKRCKQSSNIWTIDLTTKWVISAQTHGVCPVRKSRRHRHRSLQMTWHSATILSPILNRKRRPKAPNHCPTLNNTSNLWVCLTTAKCNDSVCLDSEKKLEKLKGKTKEMSSKDVMSGLSAKKEAILQQLIDSSHCRDIDIESQTTVVNNSIVYQYLERRLFPQMQAMTEEELQRLLEADVLQRIHKTGTEDSDQRKSNNEWAVSCLLVKGLMLWYNEGTTRLPNSCILCNKSAIHWIHRTIPITI